MFGIGVGGSYSIGERVSTPLGGTRSYPAGRGPLSGVGGRTP